MTTDTLIGLTAFLRDSFCAPKEIGACKIIARSSKGPKWVVVEWTGSDHYHQVGDVSTVQLDQLSLSKESIAKLKKSTKRGSR